MNFRKIFSVGVAALAFAACDSTPPNESGTLTAVLVSPNGAEGAAILDVVGDFESITAGNEVSLFTTPSANGMRAIVVRPAAGELSVRIAVDDVSRPPAVSIVEVSDGDDKLRTSLSGYRVEFR